MNHLCYKTIFSKRLGTLVAVGEHASSQTKGPGARPVTASGAGCLDARFVGVLALGFASVSLSWSQTLPQGAQVAQGVVSVSQSGSQMAITQNSPKAVVNWQSFDIGQNAQVHVLQPSSQSVLLNRVLSDNPTQILGQLQANGQVVLVNPKGIVVGSDGSVSASAFTASTLQITDADFMAGNARYTRNGSTGQVVNQGRISVAPGGYVALLGTHVSNEGQIIAPQGGVALGAAETVTAPVGRTGKIKLELTPASINAVVANHKNGVIVAEGGQVYLQAAALGQAVASVLHSGHIDTSGMQGGAVHVLADGGQIKVDGRITANSSHPANKGGDIVIGRDLQTGALAGHTDVSGAQLESQGGFVETSGHRMQLDAAQVKAAQWLIDPYDIDITDGALTTGYTSKVSATTLGAALTGGTTVTITTDANSGPASNVAVNTLGASTGTGNIRVSNAINAAGAGTLELLADNRIDVAAAISGTNLNVKLAAGRTTASGGISLSGTINTRGGSLVVNTNKGGIEQLASINPANATGNVTYQTQGGRIMMRFGTVLNGNHVLLDNTGSTDGVTPGNQFNAANEPGIYIFNASVNAGGQVTMLGKSESSHGVQIQNSFLTGTITKIQGKAIRIDGQGAMNGVLLFMNVPVTATQGDIHIKGQGGSGVQDISIQDTSKLVASNGNIRLEVPKNMQLGSASLSGTGIHVGNLNGFSSQSLTLASTAGQISITGPVDYSATGTGAYKPALLTLQTSADKSIGQSATGSLKLTALELLGGAADLSTAANQVGTVAADLSSLNLKNEQALEIGLAGASAGITATGPVAVTTQSGHLSVTQAVHTTDATHAAIVLNAGASSAAGTASGGDIQLSGAYGFSTGEGGRTSLFTGNTGHANLTSLVGSGSGRFRYNSDESAANYSTALGSGLYAIYREQPQLTVQVNDASKTYDGLAFSGGALNTTLASGSLLNGDTFHGATANAVYGGSAQGAKNASASAYDITASDNGGKSALGYGVTYTPGKLTVNKADLTVTAIDDARFVGRTDAANYAGVHYTGLVNGETSSVLGGTLTITRSNPSALDAGVYPGVLMPSGLRSDNYNIRYAPGTYTIVPANQLLIRNANVGATYGSGWTYDPTAQYLDDNDDTIITLSRTGSGHQFTFSDGLSTSVSTTLKPYLGTQPAALSSSGHTVVGNYSIKDLNPTVVGSNFVGAPVFVGGLSVNTKAITPNASGVSKVYDGTTAMTNVVLGMSGQIANDVLSISGTGAFNSKNVGENLGYTIGNMALSGADARNYHLAGDTTSFSGTNGVITPAPLKLTTADVSKTYDGTTSALGTAVATQGTQLFGTDTVSGGSFAFTDKNAGIGNKVVQVSGVTLNDGNNGNNYTVEYVHNTSSTIHKADLTLKAVTDTKTYDGTTLSGQAIDVINASGSTDVVTASQVFVSKNVLGANGSTLQVQSGYTVKDTAGADMSGNYNISTTTATGTIHPKDVTLSSIAASHKTYDGTNAASITSGTLQGTVNSETLGLSGAASFADKHAANGKTVTVADVTTLTPTDGTGSWANYKLTTTGPLTTTANILPRALTLAAAADTKTYDGTTRSSAAVLITGAQTGDTISASQVFASKHALGTGNSVLKVDSFTIQDGNNGNNYTVASTDAAGTIHKASLTVTASQVEKTYDGTTAASGTGTVSALAGQAAGESVKSMGSQAFLSKNAGTNNKYVRASGVTLQDSASADVTGNYDITYIDNTTSTIHKANLLVSLADQTKVYDGTPHASLAAGAITATGVTVGGITETATVTQTAGTYNSKNVASAHTVTATLGGGDFTPGTADLNNYNLPTSVSNTRSAITQANLNVSLSRQTKVYDGTTHASLAAGAITATGVTVGGVTETATVTQTAGTYNSKNVASAHTVTATLTPGDFTPGTADLANYKLPTSVSNTASTITPAALTLTANSDTRKVYNGAEQSVSGFTITSGSLQGTDSQAVDLAGITAGAKATHAGTYTSTVDDAAYINGNYAITKVNGTLFIDPKEVSLSAAKTYDGHTTLTGSQLSIATGVGSETLGYSFATIHSQNVADNSTNFVNAVRLTDGTHGGLASNYKLPDLTVAASGVNTVALSPKVLTGQIADVTTTYGTGAATGTVSLSGKIGSDDVAAASAASLVAAATSTSGHLKAGRYAQTVGTALSGAHAGNYSFAGFTTATANYTVNPLALTGAIAQGLGTYGDTLVPGAVNLTNKVGNDVVSASGVNIDTTGRTSTSGHLKAGMHTGIQTLAGLTGADMDNYSFANIQGDYKVTPLALTGTIAQGETIYGSALQAGAVNLTNKQGSDLVQASGVRIDTTGRTSTSGHLRAGDHTGIQSLSGLTGVDKDNYSFADIRGDYKVNKLALTGVAIAGVNTTYGTAADAGAVSFGNVQGADQVTASASVVDAATSTSGHLKAGSYKQTTTTLNGEDAANYSFAGFTTADNNHVVNKLALTGAAIADVNTTYGTAADAGAVSFGNVQGADQVTASASVVDAATSTSGQLKAGSYKQTATTLSGEDAANYSFAGFTTAGNNYVVDRKNLTISASAADKVYDTTTNASVTLSSDRLAGDRLSLSQSSAHFDNKNAGTSKTVTVNGLAISGTDADNYKLTHTTTTTTATISKADLTLKAVEDEKIYDGHVSSSKAVLVVNNSGGHDTVVAKQEFTSKNVLGAHGSRLQLTSDLTIQDADGVDMRSNYNIKTETAQGTIIPKAITLSGITAANKTYDGNTNAAVSVTNAVFNGMVADDQLTVASTGVFSDKNAAIGKTVALKNTLGGADLGNYIVADQASTSADISKKAITLTGITAANKTYDGNTSATVSVTGAVFNGMVGDDQLSVTSTGAFSDKNAAIGKTVALKNTLGGADLGNYTITDQASTRADIARLNLHVSGMTADSKVYDGNTQAKVRIDSANFEGLIQGDVVKISATGNFDTRHVGQDKQVKISSVFEGLDVDNYNIFSQSLATAHITPAPLQVKAQAVRKTYDGTTTAQGAGVVVGTLAGAAAGDRVASSGSLSFTDKNAGAGKTVTVKGVRLIDGDNTDVTSNYSITYIDSVDGVIDRANASISAAATSLIYNGQTQSQTQAVYSGILPGDDVQASGLANGRNAGSYLSALSAFGTDVGNYNITFNNAALNIGKKPASLSALDQSVVYNGLTQSLVATQNSGFIAGDALTFGGLPSGRDVGRYSSALTVSGADAANYEITVGNGTLTITPKEARVWALDQSVTYNGQTQVQSAAAQQGFIAGDDIVISGLARGRNAGTYSSNLSVGGADAANYTIRYQQGALTIQKARLGFVGTTALDKLADGSTLAQVNAGTITGLVGNESLDITSVTGQFEDPFVGTDKPVQVVYGLSNGRNGGLISNYEWSPTVVKASITARSSSNIDLTEGGGLSAALRGTAPSSSNTGLTEVVTPKSPYSRLYFQGFGGLGGVGAATGQASYTARQNSSQACTPKNLEDCLCERPDKSAMEICYPAEPRQQARR